MRRKEDGKRRKNISRKKLKKASKKKKKKKSKEKNSEKTSKKEKKTDTELLSFFYNSVEILKRSFGLVFGISKQVENALKYLAQSVGAVEYTDCTSVQG